MRTIKYRSEQGWMVGIWQRLLRRGRRPLLPLPPPRRALVEYEGREVLTMGYYLRKEEP